MPNESEIWSPIIAQITALATLNGVLIGLLRVAKVLPEETLEDMFDLAESLLPDQAGEAGIELLETVRLAASQIEDG